MDNGSIANDNRFEYKGPNAKNRHGNAVNINVVHMQRTIAGRKSDITFFDKRNMDPGNTRAIMQALTAFAAIKGLTLTAPATNATSECQPVG